MKKKFKTRMIYDYLLKIILKNKYVVGYKLPSENELADKFGSSRMCAQLAYEKLAAENLVTRIKRKGCFINTQNILNPQNLNTPSEIKIALIFPMALSKFLNFIYSSILNFFKRLNIFPVLYFTNDEKDENVILQVVTQKHYDGIIFYPINSKKPNPLLVKLINRQFPIVLIDRYYNDLDSYTVSSNHFASSYKIVEYLHNRECKRICFITEPPIHSSIKHRHNGYQTAISHFPEMISESRVLIYAPDQNPDFDTELNELMQNRAFDSIITTSGALANIVIVKAKKYDLEIGKDFYLALYDEEISFDDIIDFSYVKLVQDTAGIGNTVAEILFKLLCNESVEQRQYSIPTILTEVTKTTQ